MLSIIVALVCVILVGLVIVGIIPFAKNMSKRSDEYLFVSIFSKSMFWSVAMITFNLVSIILFISLLYLSSDTISLVFGIL